jgi:hypothetical protein
MTIKKVLLIFMCLIMSSQIHAEAAAGISLSEWSLSKEKEALATRQECRMLLESITGKAINKTELLARPNDFITREEMAQIIVNIAGYEGIAKGLNIEAATIMKDLKLINGDNNGVFNPNKKLTVSEVITIMKRIEDRLSLSIDEIHSSYAIKSSEQISVIKNLDSVSFGWSQVEYDKTNKKVSVNTTSSNQNDFNVPQGFEVPLRAAEEEGALSYLMVYLNDRPIDITSEGKQVTLAGHIFNHQEERLNLIHEILNASRQIVHNGSAPEFDGVTIDFENFYNASLTTGFNIFLKELKEALVKENKKLYVALQPSDYYKGYDYKTIGQIADRVILMAHDYAPKALTDAEMQLGLTVTPITPIHAIYRALKEITDSESGIDPSKVMLQISFASTQWQVKDNKVINKRPYTPSYDKIFLRLQKPGTQVAYSSIYQNPYAIYYDGATKNVIWYENMQSVQAKIDLAKMFGVSKISLWRLGTIPGYVSESGKDVQLDIMTQLSLLNQ